MLRTMASKPLDVCFALVLWVYLASTGHSGASQLGCSLCEITQFGSQKVPFPVPWALIQSALFAWLVLFARRAWQCGAYVNGYPWEGASAQRCSGCCRSFLHCHGSQEKEIPQLLLSGGGSSCAGRVEVLMDGVWGSVCDGGWDALDAEVTCRHMNCGSALAAYRGSYYGSGPSKTHLQEVQCNGSEQFLWECESDRRHYCTAGEHAGVLCTGHREVRLSGGRHNCSGRVEVFKDGVWMTVCDSHWYPADSEMLCHHLGCGPFLKQTKHKHTLGNYVTLFCDNPNSLWDCVFKKNGHFCFQAQALGIACQGHFQEESTTVTFLNPTDVMTSLQGQTTGSSPANKDGVSWSFIISCILLICLLFIIIVVFSAIIWRLRRKQKSWKQNSLQAVTHEDPYYRTASLRPTRQPDDSLQIPVLYTNSIPRSPYMRNKTPVPATIPCVPPIAGIIDEDGLTREPPKLLATFQDSMKSQPEVAADPPDPAMTYCNFEKNRTHASLGVRESSSTSSGEQGWYENYRYQGEGRENLTPPPQSYDGSSDYDDFSSNASV